MDGAELRQLRESWGLSQVQLAHLLEYNPKVLSDIERGRKPVPKMLEKLLLRENTLRQIKKLLDALDSS